MFGPPDKIDGQCNARLYIGDDYGDNQCTIQCKLDPGHDGEHCETFARGGKPVRITWSIDEDAPTAEDSGSATVNVPQQGQPEKTADTVVGNQ